jgi:hypothetical protein
MIEINLLPEDLRQTEGTPIARLAAIMASVVVACGLGVLIAFYYMVYIPRIKDDIKQREADIVNLKQRKEEVDAIEAQIAKLKEKVAALDNLNQSRMRYGRLLNKLCDSMPEGVWFKGFSVTTDAAGGGGPGGGGKRYMITLQGTVTGATPVEMDKRITELVNGMVREFSIVREEWKGPPGATPPPLYGYSKELGAKFFRPEISSIQFINLPVPDLKPEVIKAINPPTTGLDFSMTFGFEMPPAKN